MEPEPPEMLDNAISLDLQASLRLGRDVRLNGFKNPQIPIRGHDYQEYPTCFALP